MKTSLIKAMVLGRSSDINGNDTFKVGGKKFYIDTCWANDIDIYETCIVVNDDSGTNVEHYNTREEAEKGHKNWVKKIKKNPNLELVEINEYGF